jgi:phosphoribosyl 1,2-cyclic phosphodiesterase
LIDVGVDWLGRVAWNEVDAVALTHGHPDHAGGLRDGCPIPVYATADTWRIIGRWPIVQRRMLVPNVPCDVGGIRVAPVPVEHSTRAPAVGLHITAGGVIIFYAPDVAAIPHPARTLAGASLYVGDGASMTRPLIRQRAGARIGHASIEVQLAWCRAAKIAHALFTHCGSQIVGLGDRAAGTRLAALGREEGVRAALAYDGLQVEVTERGFSRVLAGRGRSSRGA